MATCMSNEDQISAFLKTILKDCKNRELVIAKGIIEGDRVCLPTIIGNVIPHLSLSIDTKDCGAAVVKPTIANTNMGSHPSLSQRSPGKQQWKSQSKPVARKCHVENGRVVGTVEGLSYSKEIWSAMSVKQRKQVMELQQLKPSSGCGVKAATSSGADAQLTTIMDSISQLTRAVKSLESTWDVVCWSGDCSSQDPTGAGTTLTQGV